MTSKQRRIVVKKVVSLLELNIHWSQMVETRFSYETGYIFHKQNKHISSLSIHTFLDVSKKIATEPLIFSCLRWNNTSVGASKI